MKKGRFNIRLYESNGTKTKEVSGYHVEIRGIPCCVHNDDGYWYVSDFATGCALESGSARYIAIENAETRLNKYPIETIKQTIANNVEKYGLANQ